MNDVEKIDKLKAAESALVRAGQHAIVRASPEFQAMLVAQLDVIKVVRALVEEIAGPLLDGRDRCDVCGSKVRDDA